MSSEFSGMPVPAPASSPFNFSVSSLRPPLPQFSTTQFGSKTEPSHHNIHNITSDAAINLACQALQEAKKEICDSPTAPADEEDVQKIQENNNNNQSEGESNSEEVTPPKNQGLIKVMRVISFSFPAFCLEFLWIR